MKPMIIWFLLVAFIVSACLFLYFNSTYYIKNQDWKYSSGYHMRDWLSKNTFEINDRVIHSNKNKGKIVFCWGKLLIIKEVETHETGYYSNKSK